MTGRGEDGKTSFMVFALLCALPSSPRISQHSTKTPSTPDWQIMPELGHSHYTTGPSVACTNISRTITPYGEFRKAKRGYIELIKIVRPSDNASTIRQASACRWHNALKGVTITQRRVGNRHLHRTQAYLIIVVTYRLSWCITLQPFTNTHVSNTTLAADPLYSGLGLFGCGVLHDRRTTLSIIAGFCNYSGTHSA
jgi:hypothetical protein